MDSRRKAELAEEYHAQFELINQMFARAQTDWLRQALTDAMHLTERGWLFLEGDREMDAVERLDLVQQYLQALRAGGNSDAWADVLR
jgi:hypothetical protein